MVNSNQSSPMHLGLTGQFSAEDIHELLGVMGGAGDYEHHHQEDGGGGGGDYDNQHQAVSYASHPGTSLQPRQANNSSGASVTSNAAEEQQKEAAKPSGSEPPEEAKVQARSERKRSREKQRRSDVNKQFADLTQLLQRIEAEDLSEEDKKSGSMAGRVTFNPANRVDLIARTIVLLESLHACNKRRRTEISSLQQQLEEAKKAGEETAARLKEAMLGPPGPSPQSQQKQIMMMVPMMMSADGSGATTAVPMMNPYSMSMMGQQQAFCPMPTSTAQLTPQVSAPQQAPAPPAASMPAPAQAPAPQPGPAPATVPQQQQQQQVQQPQQQPQPAQQQQQQPSFPYMMMPQQMPGQGFMMPLPGTTNGYGFPGQGMPHQTTMYHQPQGQQQHYHQYGQSSQDNQSGQQEQKDASSPNLTGGSNLAHCA